MVTWILGLIVALQGASPWSDTYVATARAIDEAAHLFPVYPGEDGPAKTAVELVAISFFESHFNPKALAEDGSGTVCLGQIDIRGLPYSAAELLDDVRSCVEAMILRIRESHRVCRLAHRRPEERLGQYTGGGAACSRGLDASRRRARLADYLIKAHPPRWVEYGARP